MLESLTLAHFVPLVGSSFRVLAEGEVTLILSSAESLAARKGGRGDQPNGREPFDLIFRGPLAPVLPQMIYGLEAEGASALDVFIVPIGPVDGAMRYQAIFN
ncbi:MAG: hypothetical protein ABI672_19625 [Vicinamibacteria bacterium]